MRTRPLPPARPEPPPGKRATTQRAEAAVHQLQQAETLTTRRPLDHFEHVWNPREAARLQQAGEALLIAPTALHGDAALEVIPALEPGDTVTNAALYLRETLEDPTVISVDASTQRAHLALKAGVLTNALDAAQSADAHGPIEKMLCHQMAAVHEAGMDLLIRLKDDACSSPQRFPPVELARLTNAAARMFEVYQHGCLTLQKLKTGGTQRVVVQHVHVEQGGQAVVAGRVEGGQPPGSDRK